MQVPASSPAPVSPRAASINLASVVGLPQARRRRLDQLVRLHNPPSEKALVSMWLRLNKWCDYHKIETVRAEGGFEWECQIGYVKSRSPSLLRAIAETHRKVQSIHRHQQKPNPEG